MTHHDLHQLITQRDDIDRIISAGPVTGNDWLGQRRAQLEEQIQATRHQADPTGSTGEPATADLDPLQERDTDWAVSWAIDAEQPSAAEAAVHTWQFIFDRGLSQPTSEEACTFTVTDRNTGQEVFIDLPDERFAHLFDT